MQCFTIGFNGPGAHEEGMTEDLPYAQRLAQHLDVDLHTIYVGPEMVNDLEKMIYHLDEPQADPAPLNVLFISQLARSQRDQSVAFRLGRRRYFYWLSPPLRADAGEILGMDAKKRSFMRKRLAERLAVNTARIAPIREGI